VCGFVNYPNALSQALMMKCRDGLLVRLRLLGHQLNRAVRLSLLSNFMAEVFDA
jgi:hypothetical protein